MSKSSISVPVPAAAPQVSSLVAVVDDDAALREALDDLLRSIGLRCVAYASAMAFLLAPRDPDPDCLLLDLKMPGMDGLELQARLIERGAPPPTIFLSSWAEPEQRARGMAQGAFAWLTKPVHDETLIRCIRAALRGDRSPV